MSRALFLMNAGTEVLFILPIMCLFQIIPFAVLSSTALGPDGWRYWYVADTCVFVFGLVANWLSLRALKAEHYARDATAVLTALRVSIRAECFEGVAATLFTAFLTVWILAMPRDWPHAATFVFVHLALTLVSSLMIVRKDSRETQALRERFGR